MKITITHELDGHCRRAGALLTLHGRGDDPAVGHGDAGLLHQKLQLIEDGLGTVAAFQIAETVIIAPDDFLSGSFPADLVVDDAVPRHIDAHIRGGLIGALAQNLLEDGAQHRENLNVPVIVDRGDAVGVQVERVDHIDVV